MRLLQLCGYSIWAGFFVLFLFYTSVLFEHVVVNIPDLVVRLNLILHESRVQTRKYQLHHNS